MKRINEQMLHLAKPLPTNLQKIGSVKAIKMQTYTKFQEDLDFKSETEKRKSFYLLQT